MEKCVSVAASGSLDQGNAVKWEAGSSYPTWAQMVPDLLPSCLRCQDFGKLFFFLLDIIFSVLCSRILQMSAED